VSVRFEHVSKRYGDVTAVRDVSFEIAAGTLVTLLGPSGCGKTTTLRMLAGLELPSEGRIFIGADDVTKLPAYERSVAMVFQSYALFPHLRVLENVAYGLQVQGRADATERAHAALRTVGLEDFAARWPAELSGGQQQRVALARAFVLEPKVLLFDEPLSNLDTRLRRRMRDEIRELQQRLKLTAVYVTHSQDEALSISDRIIVMDKAVVVQEGTPREIYETPRTRFVADFMGEANIVDGAAVRPHAVRLLAKGSTPLEGKVTRVTYLGSHYEYEVRCSLGLLFAVAPTDVHIYNVGDEVSIKLLQSATLQPP
jgi:iron(III) transport system ATP-binding protein